MFNLGPKLLLAALKVYVVAMWELVTKAGVQRQQELKSLAQLHREKLESLVSQSPYGTETLFALDKLKATPAEFSVLKIIQLFYLDRLLIAMVMSWTVFAALVVGGSTGWWLGLTALLGGGTILWLLGQSGHIHIEMILREAAAKIADRTGARYVVFGHSHHPEVVNLTELFGVGRFGERAFYLNSGSWVTREVLLGEEGQGMTYVEISSKGGFLKRWRGSSREPLILAGTGRRRGDVRGVPQEEAVESVDGTVV
ncbi:MAG: hypothetical protein R3C68_04135 [Myxococcota bacterium]